MVSIRHITKARRRAMINHILPTYNPKYLSPDHGNNIQEIQRQLYSHLGRHYSLAELGFAHEDKKSELWLTLKGKGKEEYITILRNELGVLAESQHDSNRHIVVD